MIVILKQRLYYLLLLWIILVATSANAQTTWLVDINATGPTHDGTTGWCTAFLDLQDALDVAVNGDTIRVADGTYVPDTTGLANPQEATFQIISGVIIEGGYEGCGVIDPDFRDTISNPTILSGDLVGDDFSEGDCSLGVSDCCSAHPSPGCDIGICETTVCFLGIPSCCDDEWTEECAEKANQKCLTNCNPEPNCENVYHVLTSLNTNQSTVLDGLTIRGGYSYELSALNRRGFGGGLYNIGGDLTVQNCTFIDNNARWTGGGVHNEDALNPSFINCKFLNNHTSLFPYSGDLFFLTEPSGGGMFNTNTNVSLQGCTFTNNSSVRGGGLNNHNNSSANLDNCAFLNNQAIKTSDQIFSLGGSIHHDQTIFSKGTELILNQCTFQKDSSEFSGGVTVILAETTVTDCIFKGNATTISSALRINSAIPPIITNCLFLGNKTSGNASALFTSRAIIKNCKFIGNRSDGPSGGAISIRSGSILENCIFSGNKITGGLGGQGGAAFIIGGNDMTSIINCTFSENHAGSSGGAIFFMHGLLSIENSVFWDNDSPNGPSISYFKQDSSQIPCNVSVSYSDFQNGSASIFDRGGGCTTSWLDGNIDIDPLLVDPDGADNIPGTIDDNLRLIQNSPCIDAGDNSSVTTIVDIAGDPRMIDDSNTPDTGIGDPPIVDIGAYEFDYVDCNNNDVDDSLELAKLHGTDCNGNGSLDTCDITEGTSLDVNGNCIPDECNQNPALLAEISGFNKSRYISFSPIRAGCNTAIRVTLRSLYHPDPPIKNGPDFTVFEGAVRWVGPHDVYHESDEESPTFFAASLQCDSYFADWSGIDLLHIFGSEILPNSIYDLQSVSDECADLNDPDCYSKSLEVVTGSWGDMIEPFNPPDDSSQPNINDVLALVGKWLGKLSPLKSMAQLQPQIPNPAIAINISDVLLGVKAWLSSPYPFSGPELCP